MMNCDWTSKISSLIDGELSPQECARIQAHLLTCADCQRTQSDFLLLRTQLGSYQAETTPAAQQRALQSILASGATAASTHTTQKHATQKHATQKHATRKDAPSRTGLLDSLSLIFRAPRLTPARMTVLVLVLLAISAGLFALLNSHGGPSKESVARSNNAPANINPANINPQETGSQNDAPRTFAANREGTGGRRKSLAAKTLAGRAEMARERRPVERRLMPEGEVITGAEIPSGAESRTIADIRKFDRASAGDPDVRTARYVEQAQLLLRSFRNARPGITGPAFDVAHEKQRSQKLLYQNIVLRREAASNGNVPVEKLLSSLEPILIDIANLPDNPAQDDVRSIRERMQRKNIVALLQVNSASATRSN
jgi:negative regulator of sigma E activity